MGVYTYCQERKEYFFFSSKNGCMCLRRYVMKTPILNRLARGSGVEPLFFGSKPNVKTDIRTPYMVWLRSHNRTYRYVS